MSTKILSCILYDVCELVEGDTKMKDEHDAKRWLEVVDKVREIRKDMKPADADGLMPNVIINLTKE
jgi:hypothetical protein